MAETGNEEAGQGRHDVTWATRFSSTHVHKYSSHTGPFVGDGYYPNASPDAPSATAVLEADLPAGEYEVHLAYSAYENRATKVPARIQHADGEAIVILDQTATPVEHQGLLHPLGPFASDGDNPAQPTVSNDGTDGYMIIHAVRFKPVD